MLEHSLAGHPGESKVARQEYRILRAESYLILGESNWEDSIVPGIKLVMAMLMENLSSRTRTCPHGCTSILKQLSDTKASW
jgi:hypothetical protein